MPTKAAPDDQTPAGFLTLMRERFQTAVNASTQARQAQVQDIKFCDLDDQWDTKDKSNREAAKRPCLTVNQVRQFKQQIVNQQRAARPAPKISPKGSADQDTAQVIEGILRHIENPDDLAPAETWIDLAFDQMVTGGAGHLRVYTRYQPKTRKQTIVIGGIENPLSVYLDPTFKQPDSSDKRFGFIATDYPMDEVRKRWKLSDVIAKQMMSELSGLGDGLPNWLPEGQVRTVEYFYLEDTDVPYVVIHDPQEVTGTRAVPLADVPQGAKVIDQFTEKETKCYRALCTGTQILEGNEAKTAGAEVVFDKVPIIPVFGDMTVLNGQRYTAGMVRYMRDPAKMINFLVSALAENIALMPKPKWLAEFSTVEDFQDIWRDANNAAFSFLPWNAKAAPDGAPVPPPQMITNEPPVQAIVEGLSVFTNMIQATASLHDPSLGKQKSDQSGRAVQLLQQQGQVGTLNWQDNLTRAQKFLYRLIVRAIPKVYDVPQVFQILRRDGQTQNVLVHAGQPPAGMDAGHPPTTPQEAGLLEQFPSLEDVERIYDLKDLEFAIDVTTGPNFQTKRQENQAWLLEIAKIMPPQMQAIVMPLLVENSDAPIAQQVASMLKKVVGPQFYPDPNGPAPLPPEAQAAMQQMQEMVQHLTGELQQKTEYINREQAKVDGQVQIERIKTSSQVDLAKINNAAKIAAAWITATKGGTVLSEQRDEALATGLAQAHEAKEAQLDRAHDVGMALLEHGHKIQQAAQAGDIGQAQSAQDHGEAVDAAEQGQQHALEQGQQAADLAPEPESGDNAST